MKIENVLDDAISSGVKSTKEFSIRANAKSFKILSSQLYTDKMGTPVRELAANAVDSHKEARNENEPFIIHLPTNINSSFIIRDFGTGMSRHKIETLYSTYFMSDKTDTNDLIGGLGLGSKSPFCYTEQFSVVSYFNNKKIIYFCYLEGGFPKLSFVNEEPSCERNGVEISFAVNKNDIASFNQRAIDVLSYFKIRPVIKGCSHYKFKDIIYDFESDIFKYKIRSDYVNAYDSNAKINVVMGNICYPVRHNVFKSNYDKNFSNIVEFLCKFPIDLEFQIGELEVTASREDLEYNKSTCNAIVDRFKLIYEDIGKFASEIFKDCNSLFEVYCKKSEVFQPPKNNKFRMINEFIKNSRWVLKWKDKVVGDNHFYLDRIPEFKIGKESIISLRTLKLNNNDRLNSKNCKDLYVDKHLIGNMFLVDIPSGYQNRLKEYLKTNSITKDVYILKFKSPKTENLLEKECKIAYDKFLEMVGVDSSFLIKISSLPKILKDKNSNLSERYVKTKEERKCYIFNKNKSFESDVYHSFDMKKKYYYFRLNNDRINYSEYNMDNLDVYDLNALIKMIEEISPDFKNKHQFEEYFGFYNYKSVLKNKNYIDLIDLLKDETKNIISNKKLRSNILSLLFFEEKINGIYDYNKSSIYNCLDIVFSFIKERNYYDNNFINGSKFKKLYDELISMKIEPTDNLNSRSIGHMCKLLKSGLNGALNPTENERNKFCKFSIYNKILDEFPILNLIYFNKFSKKDDILDLLNYINSK